MANQPSLLPPGSRLQTIYSRKPVIVGDLLGGGGQGQVFRAQFEDSFCALKWYNPHYIGLDLTLRERLEKSIEVGPPNNQFGTPKFQPGPEPSGWRRQQHISCRCWRCRHSGPGRRCRTARQSYRQCCPSLSQWNRPGSG